ncbi:2'-5' RNA ligase family protein [Glycomyces niveus]|uniref:2'-5' RNA ligase family protein n=1 Tax=Glycomyces niveus TaxID=2820287 RepID=A0ABS3U205_9ACTN|nr:2'-5' RNA ligase family protein [Glycomyces sp. NEAU-S30]MBO3732770.1 2'-5' RNA ligase family protein [Glycomyces sp. NEAU-S30]
MTASGFGFLVGVTYQVPRLARDMLTAIGTRVGDPLAKVLDPHLTFVPPTPIDSAGIVDFAVHVDKVAAATRPFRIGLHGAGTFRPVTDVVYARLAKGVAECSALAEELRSGPVEAVLEHPFHPHVTVAQNLPKAALDRAERELDGFVAECLVGEIVVSIRVAAETAGVWTPVARSTLGAAPRLQERP